MVMFEGMKQWQLASKFCTESLASGIAYLECNAFMNTLSTLEIFSLLFALFLCLLP